MRIKVVFDLHRAWEEWLVEVPDDWTPDDPTGIPTENFVSLLDAGNNGMEFTGEYEVIDE